MLDSEAAEAALLSSRSESDSSDGLFFIVSHRHTVEYEMSAQMFRLSRPSWLVRNSSLLAYVNNPRLHQDALEGDSLVASARGRSTLGGERLSGGHRWEERG